MTESIVNIATLLFPIIRDILYFIAGLFVFLITLSSLPNVRSGSTTLFITFIICLTIVWCWVFNKLIVL